MVGSPSVPYVQGMPPRTVRLAHPELCDGCSDLLPTGTVVLVDAGCQVSCSVCSGSLHGLTVVDPWSCIDDPQLRDRLHHRHLDDHRTLISA
jgi:hypothetical protein